jgi:cytochrome c5
MAPIAAPSEVTALQEKWVTAEGPTPLGAQIGSSAFSTRAKYCHNGGMASAPSSGTDPDRRQLRGSMIGTHGPHRGTLRS